MIKGGKGGGNTISGSVFELKVDLASALANIKDIEVDNYEVKKNGKVIGNVFTHRTVTSSKHLTFF